MTFESSRIYIIFLTLFNIRIIRQNNFTCFFMIIKNDIIEVFTKILYFIKKNIVAHYIYKINIKINYLP